MTNLHSWLERTERIIRGRSPGKINPRFRLAAITRQNTRRPVDTVRRKPVSSKPCPTSSMKDGTNWPAKFLLPAVLGMTAGAVDVIGFLALGGLFTAHITGNLVILAAHYIRIRPVHS